MQKGAPEPEKKEKKNIIIIDRQEMIKKEIKNVKNEEKSINTKSIEKRILKETKNIRNILLKIKNLNQ